MSCMDINEVCLGIKHDIDMLGVIMAGAMLDIETHFAAHRINRTQRDRLIALLKEGVDEEEPTAENDVPVFKLRFPSPDYRPSA